jgi:putative transposase
VYACLVDEGNDLRRWRMMYPILAESKKIRERRDQLRLPIYRKPELLTIAPNPEWRWDITKRLEPVNWIRLLA